MNGRWLSLVAGICLVAGTTVLADIPVKPTRPSRAAESEPVPLKIQYEQVSKQHPSAEARIVIPKRLLAQLAKQQSVSTGGSSTDWPASIPWTTVIAGVALSLAAASGIWVIRRREARLVAATALLVALSCGGWNLAHGDLLVPGGKPRRPPVNGDGPPRGRPTILIETTDEGDSVILTLNPKK